MKESIFNIEEYFTLLNRTIKQLNRDEILSFTSLLLEAQKTGKRIFIFGNGGSASTASHFACDLNKGVSSCNDKRFKVISLSDNIPTMLAYSNDMSYDVVFLEQLKNYLEPGDLVIGISGSGNSKNVLNAIKFANEQGNTTIGITGYNGGKLREMASHSINANVNDMQISEDIHMILVHVVMRILCSLNE